MRHQIEIPNDDSSSSSRQSADRVRRTTTIRCPLPDGFLSRRGRRKLDGCKVWVEAPGRRLAGRVADDDVKRKGRSKWGLRRAEEQRRRRGEWAAWVGEDEQRGDGDGTRGGKEEEERKVKGHKQKFSAVCVIFFVWQRASRLFPNCCVRWSLQLALCACV